MHKITAAVLVSFNAAHQAAANASVAIRAKLVDMHVKSLAALVKRADARTSRYVALSAYHRAQAQSVEKLAGKATFAAAKTAQFAREEAAKHGVDKSF